jgi:hypothetical protein
MYLVRMLQYYLKQVQDMTKPKKVLVIFYNPDSLNKTRISVIKNIEMFDYLKPEYEVSYFNVNSIIQSFNVGEKININQDIFLQNWDVVILNYSFLALRYSGFSFRKLKKEFVWIAVLSSLKLAMPQDEGDFSGLLDEWLYELRVSVIFSVHYSPEGPLYPIMRNNAEIYKCLPGYIDDRTAMIYADKVIPLDKREFDITYRAFKLPLRYGKAGYNKTVIAEIIKDRAEARGLKVNISTKPEDTIYSDRWLDFIASGKTVLGTQGGYSAIDWRGELSVQIKKAQIIANSSDLKLINKYMPEGWDDFNLFTITPRHFEAVVANTCQILLRGDYRDILLPEVHYIPLEQDWSNLDEVLDKLKDTEGLQRMADRAREDILETGKYNYSGFIKYLKEIIEQHMNNDYSIRNNARNRMPKDIQQMLDYNLNAQRQELIVFEEYIENVLKAHINNQINESLKVHLSERISFYKNKFRTKLIMFLPLLLLALILFFTPLVFLILFLFK